MAATSTRLSADARSAAGGASAELAPSRPRKLGAGRAAEVFLDRDERGRPIVRKVFSGDSASTLVLLVLTGAGNPYAWCEPAIRAACARRAVLAPLVEHWFGDTLRLPETHGWRWSDEHRAHEILSELVDGRHAPLVGPSLEHVGREDPVRVLVREVMRPLQDRLIAAGCDGLVWQAGRGNPVAASNFMLETPSDGEPPGRHRWVWIDLESGVPALFAMNPLATLGFYLPKSLHHRRWLFDDVDVAKLRGYLERHETELERRLGRDRVEQTRAAVDELDRAQTEWKALPRLRRSIAYELARGRITAAQAEHYATRPWRWTARLVAGAAMRGAAKLAERLKRFLALLLALDPWRLVKRSWRFATSQKYRAHVARHLVAARVLAWRRRGFLDRGETRRLLSELRRHDTGSYLTDFAVHLMIKPPVKVLEWFIVPTLFALGWLGGVTSAILIVGGGLIARTLYTAGRSVQAIGQGERPPWVALGIGILPIVGNAAYPAQLLYSSTESGGELARFIIHDVFAASGRAVPIWGGKDSLTEHFANRLGAIAVRLLQKPV